MSDVLTVLGGAGMVAGVGMVSIPAGLVLLGGLLIALGRALGQRPA